MRLAAILVSASSTLALALAQTPLAPSVPLFHPSGCCDHKPGETLRTAYAPAARTLAPGRQLVSPLTIEFLAAVASVEVTMTGSGAWQNVASTTTHAGPWIRGGRLEVPLTVAIPAVVGRDAHMLGSVRALDAFGNVLAVRSCQLHALAIEGEYWISNSSIVDARFAWLNHKRSSGQLAADAADELAVSLVRAQPLAGVAPPVPRPRNFCEERLDELLGNRAATGAAAGAGEGGIDNGPYTVTGTLRWTDSAGGLHGLPFATVEIRDSELLGSELITTVTTNSAGEFTASFVFEDGVGQGNADLFVRVFARSNVADIKPDTAAATTYQMESAVRSEEPPGTATFDMTAGNSTDADRAFGIHASLTLVGAYAGMLAGVTPTTIDTRFPTTRNTSLFDPGARQLHILGGDAFDWDVIHHEYGHYFQNIHGFQNNPGGAHGFNDNLAARTGSKDLGLRLAWGEGWPTFFGLAAQARLGASALGVPNVGDTTYQDTVDASIALNVETSPGVGEDNEVSVMSCLWDLFDTAADGEDKVAQSDEFLFSRFKATACTTIGDAWQALANGQTVNDSLPTAKVFGQANIAPVLLTPIDGFELTGTPPTFTWLANGGGAPNPLNEFSIVFYKDNFATEVLRVNGLPTPTFTPTAAQLATIAGGGAVVDWLVEGKNSSAPASPGGSIGVYRSGSRRLGGIHISFVVDDTGSMGEEIGAVRDGLLQFITFLQGLPGSTPPTVQLVTFKDNVTERIVSNNLTLVQNAVSALSASGGGDCPEFGMQALSFAADSLAAGGIILFATDASSQPGVSPSDLVNRLVAKGITVQTILSGDCGGIDNGDQSSGEVVFGDPFAKPGTNEPGQTGTTDPGQASFSVHGDTPATATNIVVGGDPVGGALSTQSRIDYFAVPLLDGNDYDIVVQGIGSVSGICKVFGTDGTTQLQWGSIFNGVGTIDFRAPSNGVFFLRVESTGNLNYRLAVLFDAIGSTAAVPLFSTISSATGGTFALRDDVNSGNAEQYIATVFNVMVGSVQPALVVALPEELPCGASLVLTLFGNNTNFVANSTLRPIPGVTVNNVTVIGANQFEARIDIDAAAPLGATSATIETPLGANLEVATGWNLLEVTPPPSGARLLSVTPPVLKRGETAVLRGFGLATNFTNTSILAFFANQPAGITVSNVTAISATEFQATVVVSPTAPIQLLDLDVASGTQVVTLDRAVRIVPSTLGGPTLKNITPAVARRGDLLTIAIEGDATGFIAGETVVNLGPGISVQAVNVIDASNLTALIRVDVTAPIAFRNSVVTTLGVPATLVNALFVDEAAGITTLPTTGNSKLSRILPPTAASAFEINPAQPLPLQQLFVATYGTRQGAVPPQAIVEIVGPTGAIVATMEASNGRIDRNDLTLAPGLHRIYVRDPAGVGGAFKGYLRLGN